MCGRTRVSMNPSDIVRATGIPRERWRDADRYQPAYNASPGYWTPVIRNRSSEDTHGAHPQQQPQQRGNAGAGTSHPPVGAATSGSPSSAHHNEESHVAGNRRISQMDGSGDQADASFISQGGVSDASARVDSHVGDTAAADEAGAAAGPARELQTMQWGLVPSFTKATDKPDHWKMFNARSESVDSKSVFSRLLHSRRCVVIINGFYEWVKEGGKKQPYYIHRGEGQLIYMAGLFDVFRDEAGNKSYSYTILTVDSSPRLTWVHDRMPAILPDQASVDQWLHPEAPTNAAALIAKVCRPYNGPDLAWHPVSPDINSMAKPAGSWCCQDLRKRKNTLENFFSRSPKAAKTTAGAERVDGVNATAGKVGSGSERAADTADNGQGCKVEDNGVGCANASQAVGIGKTDQQTPKGKRQPEELTVQNGNLGFQGATDTRSSQATRQEAEAVSDAPKEPERNPDECNVASASAAPSNAGQHHDQQQQVVGMVQPSKRGRHEKPSAEEGSQSNQQQQHAKLDTNVDVIEIDL